MTDHDYSPSSQTFTVCEHYPAGIMDSEPCIFCRSRRLGNNYAENKMPRALPTNVAVEYDETAFYVGFDAYRAPNMLAMVDVSETAVWAFDAMGDDRVSRYCRDIASEADEYESNPDDGDSVSFVELGESDLVALSILSAADSVPRHYEKGSFIEGDEDWARCVVDVESWRGTRYAVVEIDGRGFAFAEFFAFEDKARENYEEKAKRFSPVHALDDLTVYSLANMADCSGPDSQDSAGSQFLLRVLDDVREYVTDGTFDEESAHEIADSAVPIYTRDVWSTFVDLGAYNEDPTELGADGSDLEQSAKIALYIIAERLVNALAAEMGME